MTDLIKKKKNKTWMSIVTKKEKSFIILNLRLPEHKMKSREQWWCEWNNRLMHHSKFNA